MANVSITENLRTEKKEGTFHEYGKTTGREDWQAGKGPFLIRCPKSVGGGREGGEIFLHRRHKLKGMEKTGRKLKGFRQLFR